MKKEAEKMGSYEWKAKPRNYNLERRHAVATQAFSHPLKPSSAYGSGLEKSAKREELSRQNSNSSTSSGDTNRKKDAPATKNHKKEPEFVDPLGVALNDSYGSADNDLSPGVFGSKRAAPDPLTESASLLPNSLVSSDNEQSNLASLTAEPELSGFEPWAIRRQSILHQYTTNEKLTIVTSFLPGGVPLESHVAVADRTKHRLEQLEQFDDETALRRVADLSQQDYVARINQLNAALLQAWQEDQRVQSVKIVIQCAKLLADCAVSQFYPSQFVLVTDILDTFGRLVYERLWTKANSELASSGKSSLNIVFDAEQVPETTKETARNWFYKIASVRELLPRLYVEAAILRSYKFLHSNPSVLFRQALRRLTGMARGIGNPLVAAYARCYLCRIGMVLDPNAKEHIWLCLHDWLQSWTVYQNLLKTNNNNNNNNSNGKVEGYGDQSSLRLFWPAMEWTLQCLTFNASDDDFLPLWEYCKQKEKQALLLSPILSAFPARYVAANAGEMARVLLNATDVGPRQTPALLRTFGKSLLIVEPSPDIKRALLREVWKAVMRFSSLDDYVSCGEVWMEFACRHFGPREVNTLLEDLIRHVNPDKAYESYYPQLLGILEKIVLNMRNFQTIFSMDRFVAFLDLFQKDSIRVQACLTLLEAFGRFQVGESDDLALSNHVTSLCKSLHDSLNALSLEDERRNTVQLICKSLSRFRFETDPEQELTFLVEARGNFSNLDSVIEYLVRRVNLLIVRTREKMDGKLSRKIAYFIRACVAYTYITIPSIVDHFVRLRLYTEAASVALMNNCLPQGDALLKAAISLIPELPTQTALSANRKKSTEPQVVDAIQTLMSLLLVCPDPPEQGQPLYLFNGLLNAVRRYPWTEGGDAKVLLQIRALVWLSAASQRDYLYHMDALESNDTLYGGSVEFLQASEVASSDHLNDILAHLKALGAAKATKRQAAVALDLFDCLLHHADLSQDAMRGLAGNLFTLAHKTGDADKHRLRSAEVYVRDQLRYEPNSPIWNDLLRRMKI